MTALTLALLNTAEVLANSPLLAGSAAIALVLCVTVTPRKEKVLRRMNTHTRADIGLKPYAPSWLYDGASQITTGARRHLRARPPSIPSSAPITVTPPPRCI